MSEVPPEVVARARAGDAEAFRVIFTVHIQPIRRFLRDLLRDRTAADEAAQETFVRAHGKLSTLREGERLSAFIFGIARMVAREQSRKLRRDGAAPDEKNAGDTDSYDQSTARAIDSRAALTANSAAAQAGNPETALLGAEADRALAEALQLLSEDRRSALLLRLDHGLGYPEIAEQLGWPLQKVKNEIHRARLQLREALAGFLSADGEIPGAEAKS